MNSFYNREELEEIGFSSIGSNVLISRKASIFAPELVNSELPEKFLTRN